ncbi:MAG TPA: universal stress protein [Pseudonocardia sp.]|jgi:nucleotide-binding universal stress UspA family protein|nr:universal stress protein [Pseudonocardia sp.]
MGSYQKIIVGTDGSDTSMLAVDRAGAIAGDASAELVILCAYEPAGRDEVRAASDALKEDAYQIVGSAPAESVLRDAADRARSGGASKITTLAVQGSPVDALGHTVEEQNADLLVVGSVGLNTLSGRILGSVPQSVARRSGVDVLIVHTT